MPEFYPQITTVLRHRISHAFNIGWGVSECDYFSLKTEKNLYGDVVESVELKKWNLKVVVDYKSPKRVVKDLGWYRESEELPIVAYFPYFSEEEEVLFPVIGDVFVVTSSVGPNSYIKGAYRVLDVLTFGHTEPICWVLKVEPDRNFRPDVSISDIRFLVYSGGKRVDSLGIPIGESFEFNFEVLPRSLLDKTVIIRIIGDLVDKGSLCGDSEYPKKYLLEGPEGGKIQFFDAKNKFIKEFIVSVVD